jgi:uncharacterized protein
MGQTWDDLLFAHWPLPVESLRDHVPAQLEVETFDGRGWVGVTPFRLLGLRARGLPPLPYVSQFLETNVRTYVTDGQKPGIWFFSLDASRRLAVEAARAVYKLPYFHARMSARGAATAGIEYRSSRFGERAELDLRYRAAGPVAPAAPGSLEHFLAERYCLYALDDGRLRRAEIHHPPWPLQPAEAELRRNTMPPHGVELEGEPLLHFSSRQDVVIWALEDAGDAH